MQKEKSKKNNNGEKLKSKKNEFILPISSINTNKY